MVVSVVGVSITLYRLCKLFVRCFFSNTFYSCLNDGFRVDFIREREGPSGLGRRGEDLSLP